MYLKLVWSVQKTILPDFVKSWDSSSVKYTTLLRWPLFCQMTIDKLLLIKIKREMKTLFGFASRPIWVEEGEYRLLAIWRNWSTTPRVCYRSILVTPCWLEVTSGTCESMCWFLKEWGQWTCTCTRRAWFVSQQRDTIIITLIICLFIWQTAPSTSMLTGQARKEKRSEITNGH